MLRNKGREWTDEEKEFVKANYKKIPTGEIAARINRTTNSVITIVGKIGVSNGRSRPWSDDEKNFMKMNYGIVSLTEIAKSLNRSTKAITGSAVKLGLTKKRKSLKEII